VALGDSYQASLSHDLNQGALHVPFTSTNRHHFGTGEVQVNQLASRMLDSSLDNVGTYGVRFDVNLNLRGSGPYELVLSHPTPNGRRFTAFRGSIGLETREGYREVHVGMRSGESLSLTSLNLQPGVYNPVRVSLVYPADATPGHLLSVVPAYQLAQLRERERQVEIARAAAAAAAQRRQAPSAPPSVATAGGDAPAPAALRPAPNTPRSTPAPSPARRPRPASVASPRPAAPRPRPPIVPAWIPPLPPLQLPLLNRALPSGSSSTVATQDLVDRYQDAAEAQQRFLREMMGR
jgi:hypothetical protein